MLPNVHTERGNKWKLKNWYFNIIWVWAHFIWESMTLILERTRPQKVLSKLNTGIYRQSPVKLPDIKKTLQ